MTTVRAGLIQFALNTSTDESPETIKANMIEAHLPLIDEAGENGVQVLCLQEVFNQPYFCPSQDVKWYAAVEKIPDGPTTRLMQDYAKKHSMVIVVPIYEEEQTGIYYNTAAVIDGRRHLSRQVPQDPHPPGCRLLREVLLQARYLRLAGLRDRLLQARRLYLLRPAFPGRLARAGAQRRGIYRQPVGHRRRAQPVSLEAGTAGLRRRQRRLYRRLQPGRHRRAVEHRALLRLVLHRRSARRVPVRGERGQERTDLGRHGHGEGARGAQPLAVLPRPPARDLRHHLERRTLTGGRPRRRRAAVRLQAGRRRFA